MCSVSTDLCDIKDSFLKCIQPFSTQILTPFFDKDSLFEEDNGTWVINTDHSFFKTQKGASWAMHIIASEYLLQAQTFQSNGKLDSKYFRVIREKIGLRLREQIENLLCGIDLDILTSISGERYESQEGTGLSLVLLPYPLSEEQLRARGAVLFLPNVWFKLNFENIHALRKQLNLSGDADLAICCLNEAYLKEKEIEETSGFFSVGILPHKESMVFPRIYYTGHMEWQLQLPISDAGKQCCYLQCCQGRLFLPPLDMKIPYYNKISNIFSKTPEYKRKKVWGFLKFVMTHTQGGAMIVIADKGFIINELNRLCLERTRGVCLQKKINLRAKPDYLKRFLAVDGAIFVDLDGYCYAYGVLVDGEATVEGNMARGSRFNNANNYATLQFSITEKKGLVFVRSEDGMIDIFP